MVVRMGSEDGVVLFSVEVGCDVSAGVEGYVG